MDLKSLTLNGKTYDRFMPVVDTTLTQSGHAADAATVNEALQATFALFKGQLAEYQPKGNYVQKVNGQTPDESGNVAGLATETYVQQYVDSAVETVEYGVRNIVAQYVEQYIEEALGGDY